jgi:hypothetical protein
MSDSSYRQMLRRWPATCDIRDEHGRSVRLTPHQWRHTFACRLINRDTCPVLLTGPARRRSGATRRRAISALRRMDTPGAAITFETVAREAGVSRSWLCNQPDLRAEIERLRARHHIPAARPVPDRQAGL